MKELKPPMNADERRLKTKFLSALICVHRRPQMNCSQLLRKRLRSGFTLIELMVVMTILVIIISMAVPLYQKAILRAKESVLKNNLFTLRTVIDEYTYDKQKAPQSLEDLVAEGYLRDVPADPITQSNQTWNIIMEEALRSVSQTEPGIFDVRSGSDQIGLDGTPYADW
ncbi:MAG: type II secretion system protein [Bryobacteraceae bacterium]